MIHSRIVLIAIIFLLNNKLNSQIKQVNFSIDSLTSLVLNGEICSKFDSLAIERVRSFNSIDNWGSVLCRVRDLNEYEFIIFLTDDIYSDLMFVELLYYKNSRKKKIYRETWTYHHGVLKKGLTYIQRVKSNLISEEYKVDFVSNCSGGIPLGADFKISVLIENDKINSIYEGPFYR